MKNELNSILSEKTNKQKTRVYIYIYIYTYLIESVPGYVCNPGSPRERDAASRR